MYSNTITLWSGGLVQPLKFEIFFPLGFDTGIGRIQLARRHRADAKRCETLAVLADKGQ